MFLLFVVALCQVVRQRVGFELRNRKLSGRKIELNQGISFVFDGIFLKNLKNFWRLKKKVKQ
jgi:hypothetical protein